MKLVKTMSIFLISRSFPHFFHRSRENKSQKLLALLELLEKILYKQLNEPENLHKFLISIKQLHKIHYICLIELCHSLHFLGNERESRVLLKLFDSFKSQLYYFLQFHQNSLRKREILANSSVSRERPLLTEVNQQDLLIAVAKLLEKIDKEHQYFVGKESNRYEKLEKARFFLEQEAMNLEEILNNYKHSKDEIDSFLSKKINLNNVNPSGVIKFLQGLLADSRNLNINFKNLLENGGNFSQFSQKTLKIL